MGLVCGALRSAENSSRAPGARWGGAAGPPCSPCVALVTAALVTRAAAALHGADGLEQAGRQGGGQRLGERL